MKQEQLTKLFSITTCKSALWVFCGLYLLVSTTVSAGQKTDILVVKSADSKIYSKISNTLVQQLPELCKEQCTSAREFNIEITLIDQARSNIKMSQYDLVITLGHKARQRLDNITQTDNRFIHALVPLSEAVQEKKSRNTTLVLDQHPRLVLTQLKRLLGGDKPVGILYSQSSRWRLDSYEKAASSLGMTLLTSRVHDADSNSIGLALKEMLPEVGSILIIPDKAIYNRSTITQLLLTGFKNHIPFIGYSKSLAKTGAIASVTTETNVISHDLSNLAIKLLNKNNVEQLQFPSDFRLIINQKIMESLGIDHNLIPLPADQVEVIQ